MDPDFWLERWSRDEIGFHQADGNPLLAAHWPTLELPPDAQVLVPLCGKTPDMAWLAARGHAVIGVELSDKAARAFFAEQQLQPEIRQRDGFTVYSAGGSPSGWATSSPCRPPSSLPARRSMIAPR